MKLFLTNSLFRPLTFAVNGKLKKASVASMFASAGKKKEDSEGKEKKVKEESGKKVKEESVKAEPKDNQEEQKENAKPEPKETINGSKVGNVF